MLFQRRGLDWVVCCLLRFLFVFLEVYSFIYLFIFSPFFPFFFNTLLSCYPPSCFSFKIGALLIAVIFNKKTG